MTVRVHTISIPFLDMDERPTEEQGQGCVGELRKEKSLEFYRMYKPKINTRIGHLLHHRC